MKPEELIKVVPGLSSKSHAEKIKIFGWYLHVYQCKAHFQQADVKRVYEALDMAPPSALGPYFAPLVEKRELLKSTAGYRLEQKVRETLAAQYGTRDVTIQIAKLLSDLPGKIPDLAERTYLDEALICFKHAAFRATVVMTWNLAYHHLCDYVLKSKLAEFNARWPVIYPAHHKKSIKAIAKIDDFAEELKESEMIEVCNSAGIITKDVHRILKEKLGRRNSAAHPSGVKIGQLQAEEFVDDLVKNVVLKLT